METRGGFIGTSNLRSEMSLLVRTPSLAITSKRGFGPPGRLLKSIRSEVCLSAVATGVNALPSGL